MQGSAYVFSRVGTTWAQEAKLIASDGNENDVFGISIAIDGNMILAGMPQKLVNSSNSVDTQQRGAVYFFSAPAGEAPLIFSATVKGKQLIVTGQNFELSEIYLDGQRQKKTANDEQSPATIVIARKSGKLIAPGQSVVVQVKNSTTGKTSNEFVFIRPLQ